MASAGVGARTGIDGGVIVAAVLGVAVAFGLWWAYFDVVAVAAAQRLAAVESVRERNELARDGFSYLHLPLVAAIVLVAVGMKTTLAHVGDRLPWESAVPLVGGAALYLLAQVAFKLRSLGTFSGQRLIAAMALLAFLPFAHGVEALVTIAVVAVVLWGLIGFEAVRYREARREVRRTQRRDQDPAP